MIGENLTAEGAETPRSTLRVTRNDSDAPCHKVDKEIKKNDVSIFGRRASHYGIPRRAWNEKTNTRITN